MCVWEEERRRVRGQTMPLGTWTQKALEELLVKGLECHKERPLKGEGGTMKGFSGGNNEVIGDSLKDHLLTQWRQLERWGAGKRHGDRGL